MESLRLLLWVGITGYSLYSLVVYLSRRGGNKSAYRNLRDEAQPARSLSAEEAAALQPFLIDPLRPKKVLPLLREGVFTLTGNYLQHGISQSNGGKSLHDTLGDVEVLLPYDAREHLEPYNRAEVVLAPKFAIVVKLNDSFDLIGGRARALVKQQQNEQWASGRAGPLPEAPAHPSSASAADEAVPDIPLPGVELLGQRDETEAERLQRSTPGVGLLPSLALLSGLGALGVSSSAMPVLSMPWLIAGVLLLALAAWLAWKRPRLRAARKVNRVRGPLMEVSVVRPGGSGAAVSRLFLGDQFPLGLPAHWKRRLGALPGQTAEVEMRVDDCTVLRYGTALSIDEEMRRFPPVYWGRYLMLALVAAVALAVFLWFNHGIVADAAQLKARLSGRPLRELSDSTEALKQPPALGDVVHLKTRAPCSLAENSADGLPGIDCTHLRWGAPARQLASYEVDAALQPLLDGSFVQEQSSPQLDMMLSLRRAMEAQQQGSNESSWAALMPQPSLKIIPDASALIDRITALCGDGARPQEAVAGCTALQRAIVEGAVFGELDPAPADWQALLAAKKNGQLKHDDNVAVASNMKIASWRESAKGIANGLVAKDMASRLGALRAAGGREVTLSMPDSQPWPNPPDEEPLARWQAYADALGPAGARVVDLTGMVVASQAGADGGWMLEIDAQRNPDTTAVAATRVFIVLAALGVLLSSGTLFVLYLRQASRRAREVAAFCDMRLRTTAAENAFGFPSR